MKWVGVLVLPVAVFVFGMFLKFIFKDIENIGGFMQNNIHAYIIEFFAGIGLALFMKKFNFKTKFNFITYVGIVFIMIYLFGISYFRGIFHLKTDIGRFIEMGFLSFFGIVPLLWGLIHEKTFISRILSLPIMILLGKASYIFYLIHKGFLSIFIDESIWSNKLFLFVILNVISIILFKCIEEPANQWIRNKFGK